MDNLSRFIFIYIVEIKKKKRVDRTDAIYSRCLCIVYLLSSSSSLLLLDYYSLCVYGEDGNDGFWNEFTLLFPLGHISLWMFMKHLDWIYFDLLLTVYLSIASHHLFWICAFVESRSNDWKSMSWCKRREWNFRGWWSQHTKRGKKKKIKCTQYHIVLKKIAHENNTRGNAMLCSGFSVCYNKTLFCHWFARKTMLKQRTGMFTLKLIPARRSNAGEKLFPTSRTAAEAVAIALE